MPINNLGLVVEGPTDKEVYPELIKKYLPQAYIKSLTTEGPMKKKLVKRLKSFQHNGTTYDKVLVFKDSNGKDPNIVKEQLIAEVGNNTFGDSFQLEYIIVKHELEAWLLSDADALSKVCLERRGKQVPEITGSLEEIQDPKNYLTMILAKSGVPSYLPELARKIAFYTSIEKIRYRCPRYQLFERALI